MRGRRRSQGASAARHERASRGLRFLARLRGGALARAGPHFLVQRASARRRTERLARKSCSAPLSFSSRGAGQGGRTIGRFRHRGPWARIPLARGRDPLATRDEGQLVLPRFSAQSPRRRHSLQPRRAQQGPCGRMSGAGSFQLALLISAVAALPLLLNLRHDVILHNVLSRLAPHNAPFPPSALPTHSGYLTANPAGPTPGSARLYYMFYEAIQPGSPLSDTPLILWLQGGPGCSSLIGNFYELGPWRISEGLTLSANPGAWNNKYAVLFIDNPVGTGFSIADRDEDIPTDQAGVVEHLYNGLLEFFEKFPEHRDRPFFVAGESYAGKYVPALARFLVGTLDSAGLPLRSRVEEAAGTPSQQRPLRLDGAIIGNALVHPRTQVQTHADTAYYTGIIDRQQKVEVEAWAARVVGHVDREEWADAYQQRTELVNWIQNITGLATLLDVRRERAYHFNRNRTEWLALVLNRPQVKEALGADSAKTWVSCCPRVRRRMANDTMKSTKKDVEFLLPRLPVLMYQGMFDLKDGAACSEEWMREMAWAHTKGFFDTPRSVWTVAGETAGYWRSYGSLSHVVLLGAGHEVPADQTVHSQAMLEKWVELQLESALQGAPLNPPELAGGQESSKSPAPAPPEPEHGSSSSIQQEDSQGRAVMEEATVDEGPATDNAVGGLGEAEVAGEAHEEESSVPPSEEGRRAPEHEELEGGSEFGSDDPVPTGGSAVEEETEGASEADPIAEEHSWHDGHASDESQTV